MNVLDHKTGFGSSPRTRGTLLVQLFQIAASRFIPAHAGNTLFKINNLRHFMPLKPSTFWLDLGRQQSGINGQPKALSCFPPSGIAHGDEVQAFVDYMAALSQVVDADAKALLNIGTPDLNDSSVRDPLNRCGPQEVSHLGTYSTDKYGGVDGHQPSAEFTPQRGWHRLKNHHEHDLGLRG
jgi:hypothetical protein